MSTSDTAWLGWYARRLTRMSPAEVTWRLRDRLLQAAWSRRQVRLDHVAADKPPQAGERRFTTVLPSGTAASVPAAARSAVLESADRLLRGEWEVLGITRTDMVTPDWFTDPVTGRR